jgi:hypothetical protein
VTALPNLYQDALADHGDYLDSVTGAPLERDPVGQARALVAHSEPVADAAARWAHNRKAGRA